MTTTGLTAAGVVKKYKHFQLGPIDLKLEPGSATGLLGANGAGKTTLLNCLAGQMKPNHGSIQWMGQEISPQNWRIREHIGFVTEYPSLYETLSARDHLLFASHVFQNWDAGFAEEWLKKFELPPKQKIKEYSKGMKVKLSILIAISHRADLLLLDEPTSGLDPDTRYEMQGHFSDLVSSGNVCILLSSHLFEDIENVTRDVKIINKGKLTHAFSMANLKNYIYVESDPLEEEEKTSSIAPSSVFTWSKGKRVCQIMKREEFELSKDKISFSSSRMARLEDIYFGSQGENHAGAQDFRLNLNQ